MWTYEKVRNGEKRNSKWIWTAAIEYEGGLIKYIYEVGDSNKETFLDMLRKLPDSEIYETDEYMVYKAYTKSLKSLDLYLALIFRFW